MSEEASIPATVLPSASELGPVLPEVVADPEVKEAEVSKGPTSNGEIIESKEVATENALPESIKFCSYSFFLLF